MSDTKDPRQEIVFRSQPDLLERYDDLFEPITLGNDDFYIENCPSTENKSFRFIITPSGLFAIATEEEENVWNLDLHSPQGVHLLGMLNRIGGIWKDETEDKNLYGALNPHRQLFHYRYFPYSHKPSSEYAKTLLDQRWVDYIVRKAVNSFE